MFRAAALLAVLLLASSCAAVGQLAKMADELAAPARTPATRPTAAPSADEQAIRDVIERANAAQAQAFASSDPTPMRETSTNTHYQEMVRTNRALANAGVTAIALVRIEFGDIRIDGATAEATSFETWRTEYADGAVNEQTDRNDYTLVLDGQTWRISSNVQPAASLPITPQRTAPVPADSSPATNASRSTNWSGYAASGGTFTSVTGTWTIPTVSSTTAGSDATWVGIGGLDTEDLVQAGTMATVGGDGQVSYEAWIEMLPAAARTVPLSVTAGDSITVTLTERTPDRWAIAMRNNSTGGRYDVTVTYASSRSSAEWVQEAPSTSRGIVPLDDFGTVEFTAAGAVRDGRSQTPAALGARAISMINRAGQDLAVPSALRGDGDAFTVTRTTAPSTMTGGGGSRRRR